MSTHRTFVRRALTTAIIWFGICVVLILTQCTTAEAKTFTKSETRAIATQALSYYHVPKAEQTWAITSLIDIVYTGVHPCIPDRKERRESSGDEKAGARKRCKGLLAFDPRWNATAKIRSLSKQHDHKVSAWKLCGVCSIYRYARSYDQGGKPAIRRHWRATLGR